MSSHKNKRTFIIAEAGVNHNGKFEEAIKLVDAALFAGADAVKFQTFNLNSNYSLNDISDKQKNWVNNLSLSSKEFVQLFDYCNSKNIVFLSTPFDIESAEFLIKIGLKQFKISSSELCNIKLLKYISQQGRPIFLSTGLSYGDEIEFAYNTLKNNWNEKFLKFEKALKLLYCVSIYPAPYECFDMNEINYLRDKYKVDIGFSDHSLGIELPIASVALGSRIIEKHIKLSESYSCPDANVSLIPDEFKKMVNSIRNVEAALVKNKNGLSNIEINNRNLLRKGLFWNKKLKKGDSISEDDIAFKKPCKGLGIENYNKIIGKKLKIDIKNGDPIIETDIHL
jgi:N,N'-diacetyllegionaminate synthase